MPSRLLLVITCVGGICGGTASTALAQHGHGHRGHGHHGHGHHHRGFSHFGRWGGVGGWGSGYYAPGFGFSVGAAGIGSFNYSVGPIGGFGYTNWGYPNYGPNYSYVPAPIVMQAHPQWIGQNPFDNPVLREWMPNQDGAQGQPPNGALPNGQLNGQFPNGQFPNGQGGAAPQAQPVWPQPQEVVEPIIRPSNLEAKRRSMHLQEHGDQWMVRQNYLQAYARYKQAASAAGDRAEPRFRMAFALAALGRFPQAVQEIKFGLRIDPNWPATGERLSELLGEENRLAKDHLFFKAAEWLREDIRDPDRLFLMGVLLHFDNDLDRALPCFQAAHQFSGGAAHVRAFLKAPPVAQNGLQPVEQPAAVQPPLARPPMAEPQPQPVAPSGLTPILPRAPQNQPQAQPAAPVLQAPATVPPASSSSQRIVPLRGVQPATPPRIDGPQLFQPPIAPSAAGPIIPAGGTDPQTSDTTSGSESGSAAGKPTARLGRPSVDVLTTVSYRGTQKSETRFYIVAR